VSQARAARAAVLVALNGIPSRTDPIENSSCAHFRIGGPGRRRNPAADHLMPNPTTGFPRILQIDRAATRGGNRQDLASSDRIGCDPAEMRSDQNPGAQE
jgi:hypothetical protein